MASEIPSTSGLDARYAVPGGLYTFQLTPASSSTSGMVGQLTLNRAVGEGSVMSTGPPWLPSVPTVPESAISRLGWVGPITEQWYPSQTVKASARA
jgi:hypothetical protein